MRRSTVAWIVAFFATLIDAGLFYYEYKSAPERVLIQIGEAIRTNDLESYQRLVDINSINQRIQQYQSHSNISFVGAGNIDLSIEPDIQTLRNSAFLLKNLSSLGVRSIDLSEHKDRAIITLYPQIGINAETSMQVEMRRVGLSWKLCDIVNLGEILGSTKSIDGRTISYSNSKSIQKIKEAFEISLEQSKLRGHAIYTAVVQNVSNRDVNSLLLYFDFIDEQGNSIPGYITEDRIDLRPGESISRLLPSKVEFPIQGTHYVLIKYADVLFADGSSIRWKLNSTEQAL